MASAAAAYSSASAEERIRALVDGASSPKVESHGHLLRARVTIAGRGVWLAATDPSHVRGAIGVEEARALSDVMASAAAGGGAVVLLLDSAGARVDQGLAALGAFRQLCAQVLRARAQHVPMLALLGRWCFGGASLLAALCDRRSYLSQTLLATSGPTVIESAVGKDAFDADDRSAVRDLMGSSARVKWHLRDAIRIDSLEDSRAAVESFLVVERASNTGPVQALSMLAERLETDVAPTSEGRDIDAERVRALLPPGYVPSLAKHAFRALPPPASRKAVFLGSLGGAPVGARECVLLSRWILELPSTHPDSALVLLLDAEGHAATVADERVLLADYLAHLSLSIAHVAQRGNRSVLWIPGSASGASYVAFAAPVDRVSALSSARISILPDASARRIVGDGAVPSTNENWIDAGVADALLDARLRRYAFENQQ
ncbi:MAG TPA: biotin-independent malonate decarboxylase subunit gamma [Burkholderiales bacterium]|nr:biotin-independent malonate decarboxylase subunit gamma [Burkholderiales bacterium]